mmetsp:Transcript_35157/g.81624  ORF Transcript_35157/g.81624 Transcript_35157/m.81624 type:complete len:590 (+) Transcript_35157:57-1826(+)
MAQKWEVVGGADKGGILVREGEGTTSAQLGERLSTGALVEELALKGDRLYYKLIVGSGPSKGWVSIKLPNKELLRRFNEDGAELAEEGADEVDGGVDAPAWQPPAWRHVQPPTIEYLQIRDVAQKNEPGDYYGITFPHSKDQIVEYGPKWLTQAFHKSGVLPKSNSVTKLSDAKEFVGGGAGLKCTFTVEYKEDKPYLHKKLFAKLPHKPGGSDRYYVSCMWNHDRPEIVFNIFLHHTVPFRVPKFYFGDISAGTTNFILITEAIPWAKDEYEDPDKFVRKKRDFKPMEIEFAYDKYMDWDLADGGPMYYLACCKALGKMAAYHKTGQLHPQVNEMFPMPEPCGGIPHGVPGISDDELKMNQSKMDQMIRFLTETAKAVYPDDVTDKTWLEQWKMELTCFMDYNFEVHCFSSGGGTEEPNDWVVLTHNNLQIDNAFFWKNETGEMEVGLLDWGVLACSPCANAIQGCISGASVEVLLGHRDAFLWAFIDSYAENGGPFLDFDRLQSINNLSMMGWSANVIQNVSQVLKNTKPKEWPNVKQWKSKELCGRFQTRAHCTQFMEALQLWRKMDLFTKFKLWTQFLGLPESKR